MEIVLLPEISVIIENYIYLQKRRRICIHFMAAKSLPLLLGPTWNFMSALQPMCEFVQKVLPFSGNVPLPHFSNVSPSARGSPQQPPAMSTATGVCQCVCVCVCVCVVMARRGCMRVRATVLAHVLGDVSMYVGLGSVALGARLCLELTTRMSEPA